MILSMENDFFYLIWPKRWILTLNAVYSICNQSSLKSFHRIFLSRHVFHFHFHHWSSINFNRISCTRSWKINGKHSFISVTAGECFCTGFDDWFTQMRFQLSACKIKIHNVWRRLQTEMNAFIADNKWQQYFYSPLVNVSQSLKVNSENSIRAMGNSEIWWFRSHSLNYCAFWYGVNISESYWIQAVLNFSNSLDPSWSVRNPIFAINRSNLNI